MKRDLDLLRKLLIYFEDKSSTQHVDVPSIDGYDQSTIKYHLFLMYDAGFLRCEPMKSSTSDRVIDVIPFDLTWSGHEFLSKVKNDTVWAKIKTALATRGASMTFAVVNELATRFALNAIGDA